jgi:hypothetical protein
VPKTLKTRDSGTKQVHENRQTFFEDTDLLVPEKMGHINTRQVGRWAPFREPNRLHASLSAVSVRLTFLAFWCRPYTKSAPPNELGTTDLLIPNFTISRVVPVNYSKNSLLNILKVQSPVSRRFARGLALRTLCCAMNDLWLSVIAVGATFRNKANGRPARVAREDDHCRISSFSPREL